MNKLKNWLKKHFIPHAGNNHSPHFLRNESVLFFLILVIVVQLGFMAQVFIVFDKTNFLAAVLPGILTEQTNEERRDANLAPLKENELLVKAAQLKAEDMADHGYFAHTSPDGKTPWYWLSQVGYSYQSAGENLAVNFFESSDVSNAWMNSPTHKANIVKPNYTEIGIGVANGVYEGRQTVFVAQFFGTPLAFATSTPTNTNNVTPTSTTPETKPVPVKVTTPKPATPVVKPTTPTIPATKPVTPTQVAVTPTPTQTIVLGEETTKAPKTSFMRSALEKLLTSPLNSVKYIYGIIALLFSFVLLLFLFIRSEINHPKVVLRTVGLLSVIVFLLFVNTRIIRVNTLVPTDNLSASIIIAN